jgi:hypothetical protein
MKVQRVIDGQVVMVTLCPTPPRTDLPWGRMYAKGRSLSKTALMAQDIANERLDRIKTHR